MYIGKIVYLFNWEYTQGCGGLSSYIGTRKWNVPGDISEHWGQLVGDGFQLS